MNPPSDSAQPLLEVRGLHKSFSGPAGVIHVLNGIDMDVGAREFVAIVGESGSGKSTFLHVVGTLEPADAGEARLEGENLFDLSSRQMAAIRNRKIGFVYQAHHLIPELTALENVMLPLLVRGEKRRLARERAMDLLARLGLAGRRWPGPWWVPPPCCSPTNRPATSTNSRPRVFTRPCVVCAARKPRRW